MGFSRGSIPFGDNCEGFRGGSKATGTHARNEGPEGAVITEASRYVDGVIEGGSVVGVGRMVGKEVEEMKGLGPVVPKMFKDCID